MDTTSVLFLGPQKGDRIRAWDVNCKRFKSFGRPQLLKLTAQLTSFKKTSIESIVDYLTRADGMQNNLALVIGGTSGKMFVSIVLKGLPKEYENFATLEKYSREERTLEDLEEIKRDLINFDNKNVKKNRERILKSSTEMFRLPENGTYRKECRLKETVHEQTDVSPMKCFRCG